MRLLAGQAATGVIGGLFLLAVLAHTVGLGPAGWAIGVAYLLVLAGALIRAVRRSGRTRLGPADAVTLTRAVLVGGLTALVADSFAVPASAPVAVMVALASVALALDAVDGKVARRTGTVTPVGARFDMEVDAFLVLVLASYDVRLLGGWVLLIGLAHSTLESGLWVDSQQRYDQLMESNRPTLLRTFGAAGWRTVLDVPANRHDWPEATTFYGADQVYDSRDVGYAGPDFGFATIPDQYTLAFLQRTELAPANRPPVFAEIDLQTSHTPWVPLPSMVDWRAVGDGAVFSGQPERSPTVDDVWADPASVRAAYGKTIEYSLSTLISFVLTYGDDNLVVVALGDHQPASIVSGDEAGHDVPVTIISRDPSVAAATAGWGWQPGLHPSPDAPVWRMDAFHDRFLNTFDG